MLVSSNRTLLHRTILTTFMLRYGLSYVYIVVTAIFHQYCRLILPQHFKCCSIFCVYSTRAPLRPHQTLASINRYQTQHMYSPLPQGHGFSTFQLIAFADTRMSAAVRRLKKQAKRFQLFNSIRTFNENTLDSDFTRRYADKLRPDVRGYGYWCWKSHIILQCTRALPEGGALLYLDAGCHLNVKGKARMLEYLKTLQESPTGVLAFSIGGTQGMLERQWTKGDVFAHYHCTDNEQVTNTPQIAATHIFVRKCPESIAFLEAWNNAWQTDFTLIDDTLSREANLSGFKDHRHDQSLLSVQYKLSGSPILPAGHNWAKDWSTLKEYPILDMRDKYAHWPKRLRLWKTKLAMILTYFIPSLHEKYQHSYLSQLERAPYLTRWW